MFYLLLHTQKLLCLTDNNNVADIFCNQLNNVKTFERITDAMLYIDKNITYDELWDFGIRSSRHIKLGHVFYK